MNHLLILTLFLIATINVISATSTFAGETKPSPPRRLLVAIPTVPRTRLLHEQDHYLLGTLRALKGEMHDEKTQDYFHSFEIVIVYNADRGPRDAHEAFDRARDEYHHDENPASNALFTFIRKDHLVPFAARELSPDTVDFRVQKQTRDVVVTLEEAAKRLEGKENTYVLLMEDDFVVCEGFFRELGKAIEEADGDYPGPSSWCSSTSIPQEDEGEEEEEEECNEMRPPYWFSLRVSFGLNGLVLNSRGGGGGGGGARESLSHLASYLARHSQRRPPDHLMIEWYCGETEEARRIKAGRPALTYRRNLMEHAGVVSSLYPRHGGERVLPHLVCFQEMRRPTMFEVEEFVECGAEGGEMKKNACRSGGLG